MNSGIPPFSPSNVPHDATIAVVAARFNGDIVDQLLAGCTRRLSELGVGPFHMQIHRTPGAFELPVAAKVLAQTRKFSAVICLGCVIRGDTPHFDFVAGEAARGIQQVAVDEALPVIFGVLTTETHEQAVARLDSGARAAEAAMEMIALIAQIQKIRT